MNELPYEARDHTETLKTQLDAIFSLLSQYRWSLGEFLYYVFRAKDSRGPIHRSMSHGSHLGTFMQGHRNPYTVGLLLYILLRNDCGILPQNPGPSKPREKMFSVTTPYVEIHNARAALTSFAAQIFLAELIHERNEAVMSILKRDQPLGFHTICTLASPKARHGVVPVRKYRPPQLVATYALSEIDYSCTMTANYLPIAEGVLQWAFKTPDIMFRVNARLGRTVTLSTILRSLERLSLHKQGLLLEFGHDEEKGLRLTFDNVQNFLRQRDPRYGRVDRLVIGCAGHAVEAEGFTQEAVDLDLKLQKLAENQRANLTVDSFKELIDVEHLDLVFILHWLQILVRYIPRLYRHKAKVNELFRTLAAKKRLPPTRKSKIHPLATNAKNETITTDLKAMLYDFLAQLGQAELAYLRRLILAGGDGLTYQKLLEMKRYLQRKGDAFQSLQLIEPILELWHTQWTNLSRMMEAHWGEPIGENDPSTLGHSAAVAGRKTPANLKKVDFYLSSQLVYLVLDVRVLDIWRLYFGVDDIFQHFAEIPESSLPDFPELRAAAEVLHHRYSSMSAYDSAMKGTIYSVLTDDIFRDWSVPLGDPWSAPTTHQRDSRTVKQKRTETRSEAADASAPSGLAASSEPAMAASSHPSTEFPGDQSLAQSILLIRETIIVREMAMSIADGDIGRAYECLKLLVFYFHGSSHTKYGNYVLEQITSLEFESHPALREYILENWILKLEDEYIEGDLFQEHLNDTLDELHTRNDAEWDGHLMRKVVSLNAYDLMSSKKNILRELGLARKSGNHPEPATLPEVRKLLDVYKREQLHSFRKGRKYRERDPDNYSRGMIALEGKDGRDGNLKKWINETTMAQLRLPREHRADTEHYSDLDMDVDHSSDDKDMDIDAPEHEPSWELENDDGLGDYIVTPGANLLVDGELITIVTGNEPESDDGAEGHGGDDDNEYINEENEEPDEDSQWRFETE
ncbi:hypothetical protein FISHEDRAFT_53997 [Fistulina hepatica ATCC 64428]|uniref:DUF6589 domain-containing protein n=1 Tax=Fistulina hepatica ATCC 64428 TaxID=1128425 RepID=A0A0D7A095_9AGAR|nr:hypothetical protein FISHEDRAFT_53997 [Fistulina hepatica ATCC 64428]